MIDAPRSLCVLRLSAIGDVCHTLPVVRTLQDHWPETHITWIVGKLEHQLVGDIPGIEFIPFDKRGGIAEYRRVWHALRDRDYDVLLHMQVALRASLLSRGIRARVRLGYDKARAKDWQWLFTNRRIAAGGREHVMDALFGFTRALGVPRGTPRWDIPVGAEHEGYARELVPDGSRALAISPCSSQRARNFRNWPVERYIDIARHAVVNLGLRVIVTGGPSALEKEYGAAIARAVPGVIDLTGRTTLKQLLALLVRVDALISPDSGPVHMANAVGTPVIGLYATSNPARTGPYFHRDCVVNRYPQALQKYLGTTEDAASFGRRVRAPDAMELITVEDVRERLDRLINEGHCS